ncbi:MAG: NAD-dependent dihydropyrimidine dehydrogenase subunit PreA [Phycisphaeraceae bacterium]|nr:NAD-dependent dihydropyrimidine dehydrogenase subunit PreA [Phycisphaeraceae bacterium]
MPDLSVTVHGLRLPNPFVVASGPPGTNANVIARAFDEGWGAVVAKTVCLDATRIVNVAPRYARLRAASSREIYGWENIELISDRDFGVWLDDFRRLKDRYPDRVLVASVMEEYRRDAWHEIVERVQETGVDALELNFSCPHGLPERRMGSAMGQDPAILEEVCGWVREVARIPVWAKMTPNVTHVEEPARAALRAGCDGVSAINTILCVMGINLDTLRPEPTVEGYSVAGGYSSKAIRPIALRMVMELGTMMFGGGNGRPLPAPGQSARQGEFPNATLHAIGGVESGADAAQFILTGAHTVQVCTGVMKFGYGMIDTLREGLSAFMSRHGFQTVEEFRGRSLRYFTTHAELVRLQSLAGEKTTDVEKDSAWESDRFTQQSESLAGR